MAALCITRNSGAPIVGVFDSGMGGLHFVESLSKTRTSVRYFGDIANYPYATRPQSQVRALALEGINRLMGKGFPIMSPRPDALVIACSYSSAALSNMHMNMETALQTPVVTMVEAGVSQAIKISSTGNIGIIGSRGTIDSNIFHSSLEMLSEYSGTRTNIFSQSCPGMTRLIETGNASGQKAYDLMSAYLQQFKDNVDTLILACSHYFCLAPIIKDVLGEEVDIVDPSICAAQIIAKVLKKKEMPDFTATENRYYFTSRPCEEKLRVWIDLTGLDISSRIELVPAFLPS